MTNWYVARTTPRPQDGHQDIMIVEDREGGTYQIATMRCIDAGAQAARIVRSVNAYDPLEVYQVRVQIDQSVYVGGTIEEIAKEAFHAGYARGQSDVGEELDRLWGKVESEFLAALAHHYNDADAAEYLQPIRGIIAKARGES